MPRFLAVCLVPCLLAAACSTNPASPAQFPAAAEAAEASEATWQAGLGQYRSEREQNLRQPLGWLSLVGLHWIEPGEHRLGAAADNDIVLSVGPAHLGRIRLDADGVTLEPNADVDFHVDGARPQGPIRLRSDAEEAASEVHFAGAQSGFSLIQRGGRHALRVRDAQAATRLGFTGLSFYPPDPAWRIDARFEAHPPGQTIEIASVINQLEAMPNPGVLVFERDGRMHRLEAIGNADGSLFILFSDRTSGRETYGAGRFLIADAPQDGRVWLDFNRAYNPPCAFNAYSTCPLPPPENRLNLAVTAGEKKYVADAAHEAPVSTGPATPGSAR